MKRKYKQLRLISSLLFTIFSLCFIDQRIVHYLIKAANS